MSVTAAGVEISNPEKVLFPDDGITKAELADYYRGVADQMLPHLRGRPLHLQRFPDGIDGEEIQQKRAPGHFPDFVRRVLVPRRGGGSLTHAVCDTTRTLVYLADQAVVTPHTWLSRADRLEHPDQLVFDLDPPGDDLTAVVEAARSLRNLLEELGLATFAKATGSRGLHVVVPLDRRADFDEVRAFARGVADVVASREPDRFTTEQRKQKRRGRLYLDTARNAYAQTAVAPYAVRALPGAPVAVPLDWNEVGARFDPRRHTIRNLQRRLSRGRDPWSGMRRHGRSLAGPKRRLERLIGNGDSGASPVERAAP
jgi:bifunctional non-homologous end joining protein LigD